MNILFLDDSEGNRDFFFAVFLPSLSCYKKINLLMASSYEEALLFSKNLHLNIIISDFNLKDPSYNGLDLYKKMQLKKHEFVFILFTADSFFKNTPSDSSFLLCGEKNWRHLKSIIEEIANSLI